MQNPIQIISFHFAARTNLSLDFEISQCFIYLKWFKKSIKIH